nr:glycosyltransferase 61 family protein [uncultured Polynucleobacter sp.]
MQKITHLARKLLFSISGKQNFILYKNQLFTKKPISVKNDRVHFVTRWLSLPIKIRTVDLQDEEYYLLIIHTDNIAHFFHDIFFPFYIQWRKNKKKVCVSIKNDPFQKEFLESVIDPKYLLFVDYETAYSFSDLIVTPEGRDLKIYPDYLEICHEIKKICFTKHKISENRSKNLIYGRNELSRKNLLDIDQEFLKDNNIEQVFLSKLKFGEYLATLASAKTFTYMVGAGVFNLLFLDPQVRVLEINPYRNNSWAEMFGLSNLCQFSVLVSRNISSSRAATQDEAVLDSHVYFDEQIQVAIEKLISSNN